MAARHAYTAVEDDVETSHLCLDIKASFWLSFPICEGSDK